MYVILATNKETNWINLIIFDTEEQRDRELAAHIREHEEAFYYEAKFLHTLDYNIHGSSEHEKG